MKRVGCFARVTHDGSWSMWECVHCGYKKHFVRYEEPKESDKCENCKLNQDTLSQREKHMEVQCSKDELMQFLRDLDRQAVNVIFPEKCQFCQYMFNFMCHANKCVRDSEDDH